MITDWLNVYNTVQLKVDQVVVVYVRDTRILHKNISICIPQSVLFETDNPVSTTKER